MTMNNLNIIHRFFVKGETMRYSRRNKILELIASQEIDTQNRLVEKLREEGFDATQATVSRDIKELGLIKIPGRSGRSCYAQPAAALDPAVEKFRRILHETVQSITPAENLIVIKTMSGCANAAAEVIDNADMTGIVGTLAGDNTLFIVVDSKEDVESVVQQLREACA